MLRRFTQACAAVLHRFKRSSAVARRKAASASTAARAALYAWRHRCLSARGFRRLRSLASLFFGWRRWRLGAGVLVALARLQAVVAERYVLYLQRLFHEAIGGVFRRWVAASRRSARTASMQVPSTNYQPLRSHLYVHLYFLTPPPTPPPTPPLTPLLSCTSTHTTTRTPLTTLLFYTSTHTSNHTS